MAKTIYGRYFSKSVFKDLRSDDAVPENELCASVFTFEAESDLQAHKIRFM